MQLDAAQRIIPGDPVLTVTRAYYDYLTSAVPRWDPAVADALMGPAQDTLNLQVGQALLDAAGRFNDSLQLFARWARLDPANLLVFDIYAWELAAQRRTQEALSVLNVMTSRPRRRDLRDFTRASRLRLHRSHRRPAPSARPRRFQAQRRLPPGVCIRRAALRAPLRRAAPSADSDSCEVDLATG